MARTKQTGKIPLTQVDFKKSPRLLELERIKKEMIETYKEIIRKQDELIFAETCICIIQSNPILPEIEEPEESDSEEEDIPEWADYKPGSDAEDYESDPSDEEGEIEDPDPFVDSETEFPEPEKKEEVIDLTNDSDADDFLENTDHIQKLNPDWTTVFPKNK